MVIELEYAKDPVRHETGIELTCKFSHLDMEIPFFAMPDDPEKHGRDIYARALEGEFGPVPAYVAPTEYEIAVKESPRKLRAEKKYATEQASYAWMMGDVSTADSWKAYYQELVALTKTKAWPLVHWPERPE